MISYPQKDKKATISRPVIRSFKKENPAKHRRDLKKMFCSGAALYQMLLISQGRDRC